MQAVSSTETGGSIDNVGYNQTVDETPQSVYERLGNDTHEDQHQYSEYNAFFYEVMLNILELKSTNEAGGGWGEGACNGNEGLTCVGSALGCHNGCAKCQGNSNFCEACKDGYFLSNRSCFICPETCEKCTHTSYCTKCKTQFWNIEPFHACGSACNENCGEIGCDDVTGYCLQCKLGFYGSSCENNCSLCVNRACKLRQCTIGCVDGYYADTLNRFKTCKKCFGNCTLCDSLTNCKQCVNGFYLYSSNNGKHYCYQCPPDCEECNNLNNCTVCNSGKYGYRCSYDCNISNCQKCIKDNNVVKCTECVNRYKLANNTCIAEKNDCSQNCNNGCDSYGNCSGGCKDGWTGLKCASGCTQNCRQCDQSIAALCTKCEGDFYTSNCSIPCSSHCSIVSDKATCYINNGTCLNGCQNGYKGSNCEENIFAASTSTSTDDTTVSTITTNDVTGISDSHEDKNNQDAITIGAGAGGGLLILVLMVVVVVCVVKRQQARDSASSSGNVFKETTQQSLDGTDNVYAQPNKQRKKGQDYVYAQPNKQRKEGQDYIYAQPNKPKKGVLHKKEEISKPQKMYDNVVIDLDNEAENHFETEIPVSEETDVDAILLENIDDEPKSLIMTEVIVPKSDTYYNMASLLRSRVEISKLLVYIKNKTDFENEFEKLPKGLTRTCNEALIPGNRPKNRYNGIYAYDATRVKLQSKSFINANYIDGQGQTQNSYIASLGPTKSTMDNFATFWEMVWQENSNKILMLTNLEESKKMKCQQYWPDRGSRSIYGDIIVTSIAEKVFSDFVVREFTVAQNSETRKVTQYHYTAWPDKTVPHTVASLIEFRDKVEQGNAPVTGPMIVHCSAGIGRTGTYIALDILIREGKEEDFVDIFGCVIALRGQRVNLVQNVEQYIFLHHCVLYALTCESDIFPDAAIPHVFTDEKIATQYQSLQNFTLLTNKNKRLMVQAKSRKENRKGADIPGDGYRVRLTLTKQDYINAVYVNGYIETNKFILAQTPLPDTVEDFVSMLYQERCSCIVCLDEENMYDKTVAQYIPPANKVSTFGHFQVSCTRSDSRECFVIRELKLSRIGSPPAKELTVRHYQLKGWKRQDIVPKKTSSFLNTVVDVEKVRKGSHSEQPIVIHCLTGSERSGLFCVVSVLLEKMTIENELSVLNTICQVRSRRRSAIQDIEQLRFCYSCIEELLEMPDTNTYYNIGNV
ncbi:receptor-type tyrosine-protein phosphatase kappa-like [Mercenaria mercenaria]|uniref:receptor-type tyrosine-protein phosphatase kappa-like n=1 Tax=Mercenaria mercenaria TaxID=6596 RepID=UPI00234F2249|nr:receptor-type tyrosine-protein phosphatase kappa-like [Mercenaria mercenaria]